MIRELPREEKIKQKILEEEGVILYKKNKDKNKMNTILILEPHPDDFALSALGYVEDKTSVYVLNIFSKMNIDSFTWKDYISITEEEYERIRMEESEFAIEKIQQQKFESLKEKSMRITEKSVDYIENLIMKKVNDIISQNSMIDTLMVPMGIGNHPDHIIVHNAIMNNYIDKLSKNVKIVLYPEYPYARCKKFYYSRLQEIKKKYKLQKKIVNVEDRLEEIVNTISIYKSQFDDINRNQMLSIVREDTKAIAQEYEQEKLSLIYYEIKR